MYINLCLQYVFEQKNAMVIILIISTLTKLYLDMCFTQSPYWARKDIPFYFLSLLVTIGAPHSYEGILIHREASKYGT